MKFGKADFRKIHLSLLAAALSIAIGTGAVLLSLQQTKSTQLAKDAAAIAHKESDGKLKRVRDEENEIKKKSALFSKLQARGIIGEEQRLDWVELLKGIESRQRLIDLQFEITPQRPLDKNAGDNFTFHASLMKLQFKALHEEDLTRLLDDLRSQARALIQVKSCNLSRLPRSAGQQTTSLAQLKADCQIDWVTIREASNK
jgi:hypothetical protein